MRPLQKKISSSNGKNFVVKYQLLILIKRDVHRAPTGGAGTGAGEDLSPHREADESEL